MLDSGRNHIFIITWYFPTEYLPHQLLTNIFLLKAYNVNQMDIQECITVSTKPIPVAEKPQVACYMSSLIFAL